MISLHVIEALLSSDSQRRQAAEAHFQSLDVNERVFAWPAAWAEAQQSAGSSTTVATTVAHMMAVLWRRDILQCTVDVAPLLAPLQQIFVSTSSSAAASDERIRSAIGHCLAEVVALVQTSAALEQALQGMDAVVSDCCCIG